MIKVGTYIGTGSNDVLPEIIWRDQTQQQWIDKAVEQYRLHGVSVEKAKLWAESLLNNNSELINHCPYLAAEECYRN
tara:strand:- start:1035 stop:1265 length:231 start_codon:yes stop_codon:yes gene_type:complete